MYRKKVKYVDAGEYLYLGLRYKGDWTRDYTIAEDIYVSTHDGLTLVTATVGGEQRKWVLRDVPFVMELEEV